MFSSLVEGLSEINVSIAKGLKRSLEEMKQLFTRILKAHIISRHLNIYQTLYLFRKYLHLFNNAQNFNTALEKSKNILFYKEKTVHSLAPFCKFPSYFSTMNDQFSVPLLEARGVWRPLKIHQKSTLT